MERIDHLLATTGIHQIARLSKAEWAYIKRLVAKGRAFAAPDYGFPRLTKRYFAVEAA